MNIGEGDAYDFELYGPVAQNENTAELSSQEMLCTVATENTKLIN